MSSTDAPPHQDLHDQARHEALRWRRYGARLGWLRLLIAVLTIVDIALYLGTPGPLPFIGAIILGIVFLALGPLHDRADQERRRADGLAAWHQTGLHRMAGVWPKMQDPAPGRFPDDHPVAHDCDIAGDDGVFVRLDTGAGPDGLALLASWLDGRRNDSESRAATVRALIPRHAWRGRLAVAARTAGSAEPESTPPAPTWIGWLSRVVPLLAGALLITVYARLGMDSLPIALLLTAAVLAPIDRLANRWLPRRDPDLLRAAVLARGNLLATTAELADDTEPRLVTAATTAATASASGSRLSRILDQLARERDPVWGLLISPLLLLRWRAAARWRIWNDVDRAAWLIGTRATAEIEALSCLATWAAEQGGCWAEWTTDGPVFSAERLTHPLLPPDTRIGNHISIEEGSVILITGANAAGKSTFLRSCCLAATLAAAGTTAPAARLRLRSAGVGAAMRARDDLSAGRSRFQAEVARLVATVAVATRGRPALIALDEILAGTNATERRAGTRAVLADLVKRGCAVLSATHDLELCAELQQAGLASSMHFADRVEDGALVFDYLLRNGVATSTNALAVMRAAGLPVDG